MLRKWVLPWIVRINNKANMSVMCSCSLLIIVGFFFFSAGYWPEDPHTLQALETTAPPPAWYPKYPWSMVHSALTESTGTEGQLHRIYGWSKFSIFRLLGCCFVWFFYSQQCTMGTPGHFSLGLNKNTPFLQDSEIFILLGFPFVCWEKHATTPLYRTIPLMRTFSVDSVNSMV